MVSAATRDQELAVRSEEIRRRDTALEREQQLAAFFAERLRESEPAARGEQESPGAPEMGEAAGPPEAARRGLRGAEDRPGAQTATSRPWGLRWFGG